MPCNRGPSRLRAYQERAKPDLARRIRPAAHHPRLQRLHALCRIRRSQALWAGPHASRLNMATAEQLNIASAEQLAVAPGAARAPGRCSYPGRAATGQQCHTVSSPPIPANAAGSGEPVPAEGRQASGGAGGAGGAAGAAGAAAGGSKRAMQLTCLKDPLLRSPSSHLPLVPRRQQTPSRPSRRQALAAPLLIRESCRTAAVPLGRWSGSRSTRQPARLGCASTLFPHHLCAGSRFRGGPCVQAWRAVDQTCPPRWAGQCRLASLRPGWVLLARACAFEQPARRPTCMCLEAGRMITNSTRLSLKLIDDIPLRMYTVPPCLTAAIACGTSAQWSGTSTSPSFKPPISWCPNHITQFFAIQNLEQCIYSENLHFAKSKDLEHVAGHSESFHCILFRKPSFVS
jgi:hypothetical protein